MSILKKTDVASIEVLLPSKILKIRTDTIITDDGVEIARTPHRHCLSPGDDLTNQDPQVVAQALAAWAE